MPVRGGAGQAGRYDRVVSRIGVAWADRARMVSAAAVAVGFVIAAVLAFRFVQPLTASPVGYDTAASVLYFQRIIHGQVLERPYAATPKALMTVVDGLLYALGGWRAISLSAVLAFAVVVTGGAALAGRLAGPAAATFAFVSLLGSRPLLLDTSLAYATPWAAIFLLIAAFGALAAPRRYAVIGLSLGAATLCRLESIVVLVGAVGAIAAWWVAARRGREAPPPRAAWLVSLGLLAIPIMLIHDWILIRDPMYWAGVSAGYAISYPSSIQSPPQITLWLIRHYMSMPLLTGLAIVGGIALVLRRHIPLATGLLLLGPGVGAFIILLAARGTYVSSRYVYLADLAVVAAAAVGVAAIRLPEIEGVVQTALRRARLSGWLLEANGALLVLGAAALVALAAAIPFAPRNADTRAYVRTQVLVADHLIAVEPHVREAIAADGVVPGVHPAILMAGLWTPRLIVDLGLRIRRRGEHPARRGRQRRWHSPERRAARPP